MQCPLCKSDLALDTVVEGHGGQKCTTCGATLDQYFEQTESVILEKIGRFTILHILGEGGFGTVYKALDSKLDRTVALKVLRTDRLGSTGQEARLVREAKAASLLNHPGIVKIYDLVEAGTIKVLVEECIEGDTLDDLLRQKKLSLKKGIEAVVKIADALAYAHEKKVIHRDIKPANIMIDDFGQPKILDFGLAKREGIDESMTQEGQLVGTIVYMSPEQANGQVRMISEASDQYSLGIILFQIITGELPFRGAGNMILRQIGLDDPPHPRTLNDSISRDLENICLKTLSKKIGDRYRTIADFAADLRHYMNDEPVYARPVGVVGKLQRWAKRHRTLAASLASIAAILLVATAVSTYFAFKSFHDLQGRIAAEQATQQTQLKLLLEGDTAEIRPVIQSFRENLSTYETSLRNKQNDTDMEPHKKARVLLTLSEKEPALEEKLYLLIELLPTPEALLVNEFLKNSPSVEREQQLWNTLKNRQVTPAHRLSAAAVLAKTKAQHPQWPEAAKSVLDDLLDPFSTRYLPLWMTQLKPVRHHLQESLILECSKKTDHQRATLAATVFLQLYGDDIPALIKLMGHLPAVNAPLLIEHLKSLKQPAVIQTTLRKLAEPGAERSSLIAVPANLPAPSIALQKKLEASSGLLHASFAICSALPWPDVAGVMKEMAACGYRPVRFRPYSTGQGLRAAAIWHRDHQPGSADKWEFAFDLSASDLEMKANQCRAKGWQPLEVSSYEVERRVGLNEVRYAWISAESAAKLPFQMMLDVKEMDFLPTNQNWLFTKYSNFHRTGVLDLEKGSLPVGLSVRGSKPGQASFTHVISSIPDQRGIESFSSSYALALTEDKFRLTLADFNVHHDIAWVVPERELSRVAYFTQLRENAVRLQKVRPLSNGLSWETIQDRTRALYELGEDTEWIKEIRKYTGNDKTPSSSLDNLLAFYWARAGEAELAQLCCKRYVDQISNDLRLSVFLNSAVQLLASKTQALPVAVNDMEKMFEKCPDGLTRFLTCRIYCLASEAAGISSAEGQQYHAKAWALAQQLLQEGEGLGYEFDSFWSRDFAPLAEKLEPLLQAKRQKLRYCVTWSSARGLDERLHYGETADLALPLWQAWLAEGYVPHTLSALEWQGKVRLMSAWRRVRPTPEQDAAAANRKANALLALVQLGQPEDAWKSMETTSVSNIDVELANELMFRPSPYKVNPQLLITRLYQPCTPLMRQRLLIALGQYPLAECAVGQKELLETLTQLLLNDPDPGVHSACDWLLRTWKQEALLQAAWKGQERTLEKREKRHWYRSPTGQEYVIFPDPPVFYMGLSVDDNEATLPARERPHLCRIGHAFALATREVTRKELLEFDPDHECGDLRFARTDDCPVGNIPWSKAAAYCNWLSKREGIPANQWCYVVDEKTKVIKPAINYLERTGYRLPVEAEFEFACRDNNRLTRFFGNSPLGLPRYVWFDGNSSRQMHPVGSLPPHPKGLFDILGNAKEWLNDKNGYYQPVLGLEIVQDQPVQLSLKNLATPSSSLVIRSLSWGSDAFFMRTSQRSNRPVTSDSEAADVGFRVGRTVRK